jgi:hypothetical protein
MGNVRTIGEVIVALAQLYLLYQQNRILKRGPTGPEPVMSSERFALLRRYWPMTVNGLLALIVWAGVAAAYLLHPACPECPYPYTSHYTLKTPLRHDYSNEEVHLDGYEYSNCRMMNVTLTYDGLTPVLFHHNVVQGSIQINTNNLAIGNMLLLLKEADLIKDAVHFRMPPNLAETDIPYEPIR